jgi:hypothetical protein
LVKYKNIKNYVGLVFISFEKRIKRKMTNIDETIKKINPKITEPSWEHKLVYNSSSETLEPVYFWILDFMGKLGFKVEKIADNFSASPGGGYFSEMSSKATKVQEEGMKILGAVNQVVKSIINIVYDLKEFEIRLHQYDLSNSKNKEEAESGVLGLKQIWMDNVDLKRGRGSINQMSYELNFATLRDAFMAAKTIQDVDKMDLNDRVKRVLKPRLAEFLEWAKRSEKEMSKRFEIEKNYLKSQVATLKMYARWVKPYLRAAEQLAMKQGTGREPDLVSAFNTMVLELAVLGKNEIDVKKEALAKTLPPSFKDIKARKYYSCVFVDFMFRGIPQRASQAGHYVFGGKVEVTFKAYALNEEEIQKLFQELEKEDFSDVLGVAETQVTASLEQIHEDIDHFLKGDEEKEEPKTMWQSFLDFLSGKQKKKEEKKKTEKKEIGEIKKDSYPESWIRAHAERVAADLCFKLYDIYKKAHGMASVPLKEE